MCHRKKDTETTYKLISDIIIDLCFDLD
uniref:Uncharacterized protein n=1 Tax=Rhizophora mucronata TaxID=61149 RepID=A0A2P2NVX8_RHIMU